MKIIEIEKFRKSGKTIKCYRVWLENQERSEFFENYTQATIHQTMGPEWKDIYYLVFKEKEVNHIDYKNNSSYKETVYETKPYVRRNNVQ